MQTALVVDRPAAPHQDAAGFQEAFQNALDHPLDRAVLLALQQAGGLRYEQLRRRVGGPWPQTFQDALDRLVRSACVARVPHGRSPWGHYRPTDRGQKVARVLLDAAGRITGLSGGETAAAQEVLLGRVLDPSAPGS